MEGKVNKFLSLPDKLGLKLRGLKPFVKSDLAMPALFTPSVMLLASRIGAMAFN